MKYLERPKEIEAFTFEEMVEHGKANGANIVNGMPWSFDFHGHHVSHETDDCYLITTLVGVLKIERGDLLVVGPSGAIYPYKPDAFAEMFVSANEDLVRKCLQRLADWSRLYPRQGVYGFNAKVDEQLVEIEEEAKRLCPPL